MIVDVATHLDAAPQMVWDHVTRTRLMRHVCLPMVSFVSREPGGFPDRWTGGAHRVWMLQFGFIPLGPQTISIEIGPHEGGTMRMRDNGTGLLARAWDHHISVTPERNGALYRDRIRVEAGMLTPFVWAFAMLLFRWRQTRWRRLVRRSFQY